MADINNPENPDTSSSPVTPENNPTPDNNLDFSLTPDTAPVSPEATSATPDPIIIPEVPAATPESAPEAAAFTLEVAPETTTAVGTVPVESTTTVNTDHMVVKKPTRKSTLILLIALLLVGAGAAYYYFTSMNTPEPTNVTVNTITPDDMLNLANSGDIAENTGDVVITTGDTDILSGDSAEADDMTEDNIRKTHLQQIASALAMHKQENGEYPSATDFEAKISGYMTNVPTDPNSELWVSFGNKLVSGYIYSPLMLNTQIGGAAILMTRVLTPEIANWIDADPALSQISDITKADAAKIEKMICTTIIVDDTTEDSLTKCTAKKGSDKLRYIIVQ